MKALLSVCLLLFLLSSFSSSDCSGVLQRAQAAEEDWDDDEEEEVKQDTSRRLEHFPEDVDLQKSIERFHNWFTKHYTAKVGKPKVELAAAGDGMRMGVFAVEDIKPESLYLSIPTDMIIGEKTMFTASKIGPVLKKLQHKELNTNAVQRYQVTLGMFVIHERFIAGKRSFWRPYLDLIPTSHDAPEFFTERQLELLQGTHMKEKAISNRQTHLNEFNWLKKNIFDVYPDAFPSHTFNYEHWMWAAGTLQTRMIWWDGAPHLVPMLDMINCREGSNPHRVHATKRNPKTETADTYADGKFKKGDQIFENYGQPNPTYFLYHGFVLEPNIHDCVQIRIPYSKVSSRTYSAMEKWRLTKPEYCVSPKDYNSLLTIGRIEASSEGQIKDMGGAAPNARFKSDLKRELKALKWVGELLKERMETFPAYDSWRKNVDALPFREKMAVTFRETQRELLENTLEKYRTLAREVRGARDRKRAKTKQKKKEKEEEAKKKANEDL